MPDQPLSPNQTKVTSTNRTISNCKATAVCQSMFTETAPAYEPAIFASSPSRVIAELLDCFAYCLRRTTSSKELTSGVNATKELVVAEWATVCDHNLAHILAHWVCAVEHHRLARGVLDFDTDALQLLGRKVKHVLDGLEVYLDIRNRRHLRSSGPLSQSANPGHLLVAELAVAAKTLDQRPSKISIALAELVNHCGARGASDSIKPALLPT